MYIPHLLIQSEVKSGPLYPNTELNLRDRVLGEVGKNSFIALPGKGGHRGLTPTTLCVPTRRG